MASEPEMKLAVVPYWAEHESSGVVNVSGASWNWNDGHGDWELSYYPNDDDYPQASPSAMEEWRARWLEAGGKDMDEMMDEYLAARGSVKKCLGT